MLKIAKAHCFAASIVQVDLRLPMRMQLSMYQGFQRFRRSQTATLRCSPQTSSVGKTGPHRTPIHQQNPCQSLRAHSIDSLLRSARRSYKRRQQTRITATGHHAEMKRSRALCWTGQALNPQKLSLLFLGELSTWRMSTCLSSCVNIASVPERQVADCSMPQ